MIASIIKTIELRAITAKDDATYAMAKLAIWWTLEASLVLIAASIPTLRPIIKSATGNSCTRSGISKPSAINSLAISNRLRTTKSSRSKAGRFYSLNDPELLDNSSNEYNIPYLNYRRNLRMGIRPLVHLKV